MTVQHHNTTQKLTQPTGIDVDTQKFTYTNGIDIDTCQKSIYHLALALTLIKIDIPTGIDADSQKLKCPTGIDADTDYISHAQTCMMLNEKRVQYCCPILLISNMQIQVYNVLRKNMYSVDVPCYL